MSSTQINFLLLNKALVYVHAHPEGEPLMHPHAPVTEWIPSNIPASSETLQDLIEKVKDEWGVTIMDDEDDDNEDTDNEEESPYEIEEALRLKCRERVFFSQDLDMTLEELNIDGSADLVSFILQPEIDDIIMYEAFHSNRRFFLQRIYHDAPDDVFELIISLSINEDSNMGKGGLNGFRLVNKRLKRVVESCTTRLQLFRGGGPDSLRTPLIERCGRLEEIIISGPNLRSLEGCPDGLQMIFIGYAPYLSDLSPLASCSKMQDLMISHSSITDISVVSSMPKLEVFSCQKKGELPSIKDLSPLSSCSLLRDLYLRGNTLIKDLTPLSACTSLETFKISSLITDLSPLSNLSNLQHLTINDCPMINSLKPLSSLKSLQYLCCHSCPLISDLAPLSNLKSLFELDAATFTLRSLSSLYYRAWGSTC